MYDLIIIGSGPGGYIAAECAGRKGKKVLLIEKSELGGVCLNEGCIPTKTLLNSAKRYNHAVHSKKFGVHTDSAEFKMNEAQAWKRNVIGTQRKGVAFLMKQNGVEILKGEAAFKDAKTIVVDDVEYQAKKIIIATGSIPAIPPIPGCDGTNVVTSTEILSLEKIPERLVVIGGGVIGMEFASLYHMLGSEVHVIEMLPEILPFMEPEHGKNMRRAMKGINFHLSSRVEEITSEKVRFFTGSEEINIDVDLILMAAGRKPNIEGLCLKNAGVAVNGTGIAVNEYFQTSVPGIYAIGDITGLSMFAHSASRMGEAVINVIDGNLDELNYDAVPWAVYTNPEAAGCGLTEAAAKNAGYDPVSVQVQMRINGRFLAENGNSPGLCKVIADKETGLLLGVQLLGGVCSEMIYGASVFINNEITVEEIRSSIFPHPSVSEVIREALLQMNL